MLKIIEMLAQLALRLTEMSFRIMLQLLTVTLSALLQLVTALQGNSNKPAAGQSRRRQHQNRGRKEWRKKRR